MYDIGRKAITIIKLLLSLRANNYANLSCVHCVYVCRRSSSSGGDDLLDIFFYRTHFFFLHFYNTRLSVSVLICLRREKTKLLTIKMFRIRAS